MNTDKTIQKSKPGRPVNSGRVSRPLTNKEVRSLLGACYGAYGLRNRGIIILGLCGLRVGTIMKLLISDLLDPNGQIKDSFVLDASREKSKRTHRYYVSKQAKSILKDYLDSVELLANSPVFPSPKTGKFMSSSAGSRLIGNLLIRAEIYDNTSHSLRKTFAHRCYVEHSIGLVELQRLLNHSSPTTTAKIYVGDLTPNISRVMDSISF